MHARLPQQDKYGWEADREKCVDRLSPTALVAKRHTFPPWRRVMVAWRKAGVMAGDELLPTPAGAPQGAVRSPLLRPVALHGLATAMTPACPPPKQGRSWRPKVVRGADDFVGRHREHDRVRQAKAIASAGLSEVG